ncbi:MAG TPA: hypothetical protein VHG92_03875 [Afifellaceae bacterium]|nr:hypothetical protein [Afifellaceae bacterium]
MAVSSVVAPGAGGAEPLVALDGDRLAAGQCATAGIEHTAQKAAFAASVLDAVERLERFDAREAEQLLERILLCCDLVADLEQDQRTLMAARLAYAARLMAEYDPELARELDRLVDLCGDRVVDVSYGAARGADGSGDAGSLSLFSGSGGGGGGGVPSDN